MMIQVAWPGVAFCAVGLFGLLLLCGMYWYSVGYRSGREYGNSEGYLRGKGETVMRAYNTGYERGLADRGLEAA